MPSFIDFAADHFITVRETVEQINEKIAGGFGRATFFFITLTDSDTGKERRVQVQKIVCYGPSIDQGPTNKP